MPPRLPDTAERKVFEEFYVKAEKPETHDELESLRASYELWKSAYTLVRTKGKDCIGFVDKAGPIDEDAGIMYIGATKWVENPKDTSIAYRLYTIRSEVLDAIPIPEFDLLPHGDADMFYMPVVLQMRLSRKIPGRIHSAELISDVYLLGDDNRKGEITDYEVPGITGTFVKDDGSDTEEEIKAPSTKFTDLKDTIDLLNDNLRH